LALVPALIIGFSACKGGNPTPAKTSPPPAPTEQYILMNNVKVIIKNPANGKITLNHSQIGDSTLSWAGNQPTTLNGDSLIFISHPESIKRGVNTISDFATDAGEVLVTIKYGATSSRTIITLKSGDFKLERVNNIWYSVLKNGVGDGFKGSTAVNYTGVEFRIAWPSTFK